MEMLGPVATKGAMPELPLLAGAKSRFLHQDFGFAPQQFRR
jgi:hypothetical protein